MRRTAPLAGAYEEQMKVRSEPVPTSRAGALAVGRGPSQICQHRFDLLGIGARRLRPRLWARRSFETATICIALVIFCVDSDRGDPVPEVL